MPRIPPYLHQHATGMLNAGMMMNAVAMNIGCSTYAIRHLWQRFQATGHTENQPHSGCPRVMTHGQDRCILRICFQTATATAVNTHGPHNNHVSAQTVQSLAQGSAKCLSSIFWLCFGVTSPHKLC